VLDVRRDFGARGDGVADDSAAIQKAIDAAAAASGDAIAYLPTGNCVITRTLQIAAWSVSIPRGRRSAPTASSVLGILLGAYRWPGNASNCRAVKSARKAGRKGDQSSP
jgi:hypothetical protein